MHSFLITPVALVLATLLSAPALAATQEYQITVPVTVKILRDSPGTSLPVIVNCAVGNANVALSNGQAVNAAGSGSTRASLSSTNGTSFTANVLIDFTAPIPVSDSTQGAGGGKPPLSYICWAVVANSSVTPVNFISGTFTLR